MDKLLQRTLTLLMTFMLTIAAFSGCSREDSTISVNETQLSPSTDDTVSISEKYLCPWMYDVIEQAKLDGKLHYYFMSSEGYITKNGKPNKWGDSCLVVFPNGETMLIDGGLKSFGTVLVANLKRMGVEKIDHLVISHPHVDHQDGIFHADNLTGQGLLDQFEVVQVYYRGCPNPTDEDSLLVGNVCEERKLPLRVLRKGDVIKIDDVTIEVLWPMPDSDEMIRNGGITTNNSSIVMRFDYREHSSLFVGDLYKVGEMVVIAANGNKMDVDLLKAPHHGGKTSSSEQFLDSTSPEIAVATGYIKIQEETMEAYSSRGIELLNDRTYGYVHVSSDGTDMTYETSREEELPIETLTGDDTIESEEIVE